jgi:hypothetical protein
MNVSGDVCTFVCGDVCICLGVYVYVCGVYVYLCVGEYVCGWGRMYVCMYVCGVYVGTYLCGGVCMCVGMYVCVCECIYIDTRGRKETGSAKGNQ